MSFAPYLNFPGTCGAAFARYQEIFGGELFTMPMSDIPGEEGSSDLVAHAALKIGDTLLMASDVMDPATFEAPRSMYVCWSAPDATEGKRVFDALADGGGVEMPFGETFFSPGYGIAVDRFGIPWMVTTSPQP